MRRHEPESVVCVDVLSARLDAIRRRARTAGLLRAAAIGGTAGALVVLAGVLTPLSRARVTSAAFALAALSFAVHLFCNRFEWTRAHAALRAERAHPESKNVVVTAEELLRVPDRASSWIRDRVVRDAAHTIESIDLRHAVPLARPLAFCVAALTVWLGVTAGLSSRVASHARAASSRVGDMMRGTSSPVLTVTVAAPAYLGGATKTLTDPERIEAIAGSRLSAAMSSEGGPWRLRLGTRALAAGAETVVLAESSYLAVESEPRESRGRRLIPVVVTPDLAPFIRIEQPGKDLLVPDTNREIAIATTATDDFGLTFLELRYTKVSGSGEEFEFQEGAVPLALENRDPRMWKGRSALALGRMQLEPGDSVVYRVVGRDGRGESGTSSSDTFFVEIAGPGEVTVAGFELPPDRERYALSQQMIVLKIERLRQREQTMRGDAAAKEAADIAAEQRAVRANFIFLTGGHVEDEEEEAAHSHEIQEGRLEHSARREIQSAIQHMSRAEQELVAVSTSTALSAARAAVEALQRAFGRNRYILRSIPVRSRLDPTRRLSADLNQAVDWNLREPTSPGDGRAEAARKLLADVIAVGAVLSAPDGRVDPARIAAMAEDALAVDAGSKDWQQLAAVLMRLRDSVSAAGASEESRSALNTAVALLLAELGKHSVPAGSPLPPGTTLRSSWAEEKRR